MGHVGLAGNLFRRDQLSDVDVDYPPVAAVNTMLDATDGEHPGLDVLVTVPGLVRDINVISEVDLVCVDSWIC